MDRLVDGLGRAREQAARNRRSSGRVAEPVVENSVGRRHAALLDLRLRSGRSRGAPGCGSAWTRPTLRGGLRPRRRTAEAGWSLRSSRPSWGIAVALVHLNDAKNELGSHRDGHRKVGEGRIPVDAWPGFFAGLPGVPVVMETPYDDPEADAEEVRLVKKLAGGLRKAPRLEDRI